MYELSKKIDFFIKRKIKEDKNYENLKVIFSNANVPGEGEHKILDFIREEKKKVNFDINETHCIYGNDSDLVLLSLVTHLPFIVLLREEMVYSRIKIQNGLKRDFKGGSIGMELIYINLLKEYFEIEFNFWKNFCVERFVDDFCLFSFFIGNDFLHQIFCMNTRFGNFDDFIEILKDFYKKHKKFITNGIIINWELFRKLIKKLMVLEEKLIKSTLKDFNFKIMEIEKNSLFQNFIKKQNGYEYDEEIKEFDLKDFKKLYLEISSQEENLPEEEKSIIEIEQDIKNYKNSRNSKNYKNSKYKKKEIKYDSSIILEKPYLKKFDLDYKKLISAKKKILSILKTKQGKKDYKKIYYKNYFPKNESIFKIVNKYLKGIDFVLKYYIIGCPSWNFTYPYKLSPLLSDIYFYLLKLKENNIFLNFKFPKTTPTTPFRHLLHILPLENFSILPKNFKNEILKNPGVLELFQGGSIETLPIDQVKDYTWKAEIPDLEGKKIFYDFIENLDWDGLSDYDKKRNGMDFVKIYNKNLNFEINIEKVFKGFKNEIGNICVKNVKKSFDADFDLKKLDYSRIKKNIFPSVKIYDDLELKKVKFRDRYVFYFKLSENSIKNHFEKIEKKVEDFEKKKNFVIFSDPVFNNSFRCNKIKKIWDYKEKKKFIYEIVKNFKKLGFFINDDYLLKMNHIYIFNLENQLHNTFSLKNGQISLLTKCSENNKFVSFLEISFLQNYKTLKNFPDSIKNNFFENSYGINLKTGNFLKMLDFDKKNYKILSKNLTTEKIFFSNTKEKLILLTPKLLKNDFNLKKTEKDIFFLLLDTLYIKPLHNYESLILEGDFQVGLQFIKIIGMHFEKWQVVNEFVKIIEKKENGNNLRNKANFSNIEKCDKKQNCVSDNGTSETGTNLDNKVNHGEISENDDFDIFYVFDDNKKKKYFNFFFSYHGYVKICEYFKKNNFLVNFLKKELEKDTLFFFCNRVKKTKIKYIFKAKDMNLGENANYKIFKMYSDLLMENHANLKLNSIFSTIYSKNQITTQIEKELKMIKKLTSPLKQKTKNEKNLKKSFYLKNSKKVQIYPKLKSCPKAHNLGDRIIFTNNYSKKITFGQTGTIIGIYNDKIEILFDDFFIGAEKLSNRVEDFRGGIVDFFEVFNLTRWKELLIDQDFEGEEFWEGDFDWDVVREGVREYEKDVLGNRRFVTDL